MALSIKQWRVLKGVTQADLAKGLGIQIATLRKYEAEPDKMPYGKIKKMTELLQVDINEFDFFCN